jgi:hypothetical protein
MMLMARNVGAQTVPCPTHIVTAAPHGAADTCWAFAWYAHGYRPDEES